MKFQKIIPGFAAKLNIGSEMVSCPSPNFSDKPVAGLGTKYIILHHTSTNKSQDNNFLSLKLLTNPNNKNPVSSHYLIVRQQEWSKIMSYVDSKNVSWEGVVNLVADEKKAWHAGYSKWRDDSGLNDYSIGIEINNEGMTEEFSDWQMDALIKLLKELIKAYNIDPFNIISHHDVAPHRRVDPSNHFSWQLLAENGVTYFPKSRGSDEILCSVGDKSSAVKQMKIKLLAWGYRYFKLNNLFDLKAVAAVRSFQRRYIPYEYNDRNLRGYWTNNCDIILDELLKVRDKA